MDPETNRGVVVWSAIASAVLALIYVGGQLLEWQGLLGSEGGPESASSACPGARVSTNGAPSARRKVAGITTRPLRSIP